MAEAETEEEISDDNETDDNKTDVFPWPYLASFFEFKGIKDNSVKVKCLLCSPKNVELSAYINSPSNLRKHIKVRMACYHNHRHLLFFDKILDKRRI